MQPLIPLIFFITGKDSERERYGLGEVSNEDTELALHAAGFILGEIGWAQ